MLLDVTLMSSNQVATSHAVWEIIELDLLIGGNHFPHLPPGSHHCK